MKKKSFSFWQILYLHMSSLHIEEFFVNILALLRNKALYR